MKIHHLGIVTDNVAGTLAALGLKQSDISETVFDPVQKNNLHFIHLQENDLWLELVEPMSEDASTAKFAKKNGMGLHHLSMSSDDLDISEGIYAAMPSAFPLGRYKINVRSFGGNIETLFVAIKGLIIEFVKIR
ncbi:MAG: VOC family protein [Rhodobacteraceae bacterium]|nr:VOC family protein [Paracoccaceae bacterium]